MKCMSLGNKLFAKFLIIIDLAVEDNPNRTVLVCHRLVTGGRKINDGKTTKAKSYISVDVYTTIIGSAMTNGIIHAVNKFLRSRTGRVVIDNSANTTHKTYLSPLAITCWIQMKIFLIFV